MFPTRIGKQDVDGTLMSKEEVWVPSEGRWVKLTVSAKGIKTINKNGIESVLADMRRRGEKV